MEGSNIFLIGFELFLSFEVLPFIDDIYYTYETLNPCPHNNATSKMFTVISCESFMKKYERDTWEYGVERQCFYLVIYTIYLRVLDTAYGVGNGCDFILGRESRFYWDHWR